MFSANCFHFFCPLWLVLYKNLKKNICQKACGLAYTSSNLKLIGGTVANAYSWPSIAFIQWNFKGNYLLPTGVTVTVTAYTVSCDGTLIDTRKILTAAQCIPTAVVFSYGGVTYSGPIYFNSYYPTIGSRFSVYLGVYNKNSIVTKGTYTAPTVKVTVYEQRIVSSNWIHLDSSF